MKRASLSFEEIKNHIIFTLKMNYRIALYSAYENLNELNKCETIKKTIRKNMGDYLDRRVAKFEDKFVELVETLKELEKVCKDIEKVINDNY